MRHILLVDRGSKGKVFYEATKKTDLHQIALKLLPERIGILPTLKLQELQADADYALKFQQGKMAWEILKKIAAVACHEYYSLQLIEEGE